MAKDSPKSEILDKIVELLDEACRELSRSDYKDVLSDVFMAANDRIFGLEQDDNNDEGFDDTML